MCVCVCVYMYTYADTSTCTYICRYSVYLYKESSDDVAKNRRYRLFGSSKLI